MTKLTVANSATLSDEALVFIASKKPNDAINLFVCTFGNGMQRLIDEPLNYKDDTISAKSKMVHYILTQDDIDAARRGVEEFQAWNKKFGLGSAVSAFVKALKS